MANAIKIPLLITRGLFIFPGHSSKIEVGRGKSISATKISQIDFGGEIVVVSQKNPTIDFPVEEDFYKVGTLCKIKLVVKNANGTLSVTFEAVKRVKIEQVIASPEAYFGTCKVVSNRSGDKNQEAALVRQIAKSLESVANTPMMPPEIIARLTAGIDAIELSDAIAHHMPMSIDKKAKIIGTASINKRLELILRAIENEKEITKMENKLSNDIKVKLESTQKEFYLREKLRAIKEELGDNGGANDIDELKKSVKDNPYPKAVKTKILDEIEKFETIPSASAESSIVKSYIDWMTKIPWWESTTDNDDLKKVKATLDKGHYGLEKVKERIVEYLAVKQMTNSLKAPILCLVGPPGVGKTSLAYSIAEAVERKFVKISLGGVKDESEIRGHRRTYLGSMPGRIIQGMKKAGVVNPVFLLDEIDKMASDFRGDPASAMLEVLDPEQNAMFSDNYLEEAYDLSKVMFITTANYYGQIPEALRDRLEIIQLSSYTEQEKVKIAKQYLVKKSAKSHGLKMSQLKIKNEDLLFIVRHYTRESGVRQLERLIDKISRKIVVGIIDKKAAVVINQKNIRVMLGKEKFDHTKKEKKPQIGVTTGLAYTQFGGDILQIEVTHFEGKGKLIITGQLGDVMKESAQIALGYVKANADKYGIDPLFLAKRDIHIHVPEGATPKDGPSAGVSITTSIISALTDQPVRKDIGMTGEVNLRGHVLPIGGLKEKSISAHRSGLKTIIIPKQNEKDLDEIPKEVRDSLNIILSSDISTNLQEAFKK